MRNSKSKTTTAQINDDLPPNLDPKKLRFVGFGLDSLRKYAAAKRHVVELEPGVAKEFSGAGEVNEALRLVKQLRDLGKLKRRKTA